MSGSPVSLLPFEDEAFEDTQAPEDAEEMGGDERGMLMAMGAVKLCVSEFEVGIPHFIAFFWFVVFPETARPRLFHTFCSTFLIFFGNLLPRR